MKILTVDVGTGTQDIFLYDSRLDLENGFKLVVPSPTMIVHRRLKQATRQRRPVLLTGVTMGGGPSQWAAEDHIRAGLPRLRHARGGALVQRRPGSGAGDGHPAGQPRTRPTACRLRCCTWSCAISTSTPSSARWSRSASRWTTWRPWLWRSSTTATRRRTFRPPVPLRLPGRAHPGREPAERLRLPGTRTCRRS